MHSRPFGPGLPGSFRRLPAVVAAVSLVIATLLGARTAGATALPALGGHGIRPPHNPSRSLLPHPDFLDSASCWGGKDTASCARLVLAAVAGARRQLEKMGPMHLDLSAFLRLGKAKQLFVITDIERVARGLPPVSALSRRLDRLAQKAARAGADPSLAGLVGSFLPGGGVVIEAGANWASGYDNPLGSNYGWMYYDGRGGGDAQCNRSHVGCWGHRDNILGSYGSAADCASHHFQTVMGAGYVGKGVADGDSETELIVGLCGHPPADTVITWKRAKQLLKIG